MIFFLVLQKQKWAPKPQPSKLSYFDWLAPKLKLKLPG